MKDNGNSEHVSTESPRHGPPRGSKNHQRHGLVSMKNALIRSKQVRLDMRFATGRALVRWRLELVSDLGGEDNISTQQMALIELAVRNKLMIDTVDNWILSQDNLVNKSKKAVIPVVIQRQQLADGLAKYLGMLGLARRTKVTSLDELLTKPEDAATADEGEGR